MHVRSSLVGHMLPLMRAAMIICTPVLIEGCATNGFSRFYQPVETPENIVARPVAFTGDPEVRESADLKQDRIKAFERGYVVIGSAFFEDSDMSVEAAKRQARAVGAGLVLLSRSTSRAPYLYGAARSYESALFLAPVEKKGLGILLEDVPFEEKLRLGAGLAQRVIAVMPGSPAEAAGIRTGDIILSVDGAAPSAAALRSAALAGKESELLIARGAERLTIEVSKRWQLARSRRIRPG